MLSKLFTTNIEHKQYIHEHMPEIRNWKWPYSGPKETPGETKEPTAVAEETVRSGALVK